MRRRQCAKREVERGKRVRLDCSGAKGDESERTDGENRRR